MPKNPIILALTCVLFVLGGCASVRGDAPPEVKVFAFADTSSVRIEVQAAGAEGAENAVVTAWIRSAADESELWSGDVGTLTAGADGGARVVRTVEGLNPRRWSPEAPHLYLLTVHVDAKEDDVTETVRFGFRRFETVGGRFLLNGEPIFLRGNAINPPERTIPDSLEENRRFVEAYMRHLKGSGINIIRSTRHSQIWFDVADELGVLFFQGNYGTPKGGKPTDPPSDFEATMKWYKEEVFAPLINHPSVVIYVLTNEQASEDIGYLSRGADEVEAFLDRVYEEMKQWDETRLYIGNAGYGLGRSGDITDIHRYWGWYYNSFLSFYTLREPGNYWRGERGQPITLTENTGNYTGPTGHYNLVSRSKQPDSQLNWTGHAPESEQAERALAHQAFVAKQAIEISRRIRPVSPYVAGLMPFTIPFFRWADISSFDDMGSKPVLDQYAVSYQPVLLSWELWTPQVYAGTTAAPIAHVVNDSDSRADLKDLTLRFALTGNDGTVHVQGTEAMGDVPYYGTANRTIGLRIPPDLPTGRYTLEGELVHDGRVASKNETELFVAEPSFRRDVGTLFRSLAVLDATGQIDAALQKLQVPFNKATRIDGLDPERDMLVTGGREIDSRDEATALGSFVAAGGRVLYLEPDTAATDLSWLPADVDLRTAPLDHALVYPGGRPFRNALAVNPERTDHPVLDGVERDRLYMWSDPAGWDQTQPGFPAVYPVTHGFSLANREDLGRTAVLANYDHGLQGVALAELFEGKGSVLLSGFGILDRAGLDPVADRLLINMLRYHASEAEHHAHPLVTSPIIWGEYGSEYGLVTGIYSGLLVNTVPVIPEGLTERYPYKVDENGFHYAGSSGGWNTRPSIQYLAQGRRPFGPYTFSLGGAVRLPEEHADQGEGKFWLRVPVGRTAMITTVQNPVDEPLTLEIEINGIRQQEIVPAERTVEIETGLRKSEMTLAVTYRGDRRLVLRKTHFH